MLLQKMNKGIEARPLLSLRRGEREVRLLNKVPNVQLSDTTEDDQRDAARQKNKNIKHKTNKYENNDCRNCFTGNGFSKCTK